MNKYIKISDIKIPVESIGSYEILHPCCNQSIRVANDTISVFSGCDGSLLFSGSIAEFALIYQGKDIWQVKDETLPGYYCPLRIQ